VIIVTGIDLAAGRGVTAVALLAGEAGAARPRVLAPPEQPTMTDEAIIAALRHHMPRVIAIDAPLSLPASAHAAITGDPLPEVERIYTRAAERDPLWHAIGVRPLPVSFLGGLTLRALVLTVKLRAAYPAAQIIEVFPTATLRRLAQTAEPSADMADDDRPVAQTKRRKTTPEARAAAQRTLARVVALPPLKAPPGADWLDAVAAAWTAWVFFHGIYDALGAAAEGQIIVPRVAAEEAARQ
jgi:predicted nuclease with RNAse H fold